MPSLQTHAREIRREKVPLLISAIALILLAPMLFSLRQIDDNALVSWGAVFVNVDHVRLYLLYLAALTAALLIAVIPLPSPMVLFGVSFAFGAMFWSEPEVIIDASRYFTQSKYLAQYGIGYFISQWGYDIGTWTDMPLVPFMHGVAMAAFGESRMVIIIMNTLMFSGAVSITAMIGRELFKNEETGRVAGSLMLAMPFIYTQVPLLLVDVAGMFFVVACYYSFLIAIRRGGIGRALMASLSIFALAFTKYSLWIMLAGIAVIAAAESIQPVDKQNKRTIINRSILIFFISAAFITAVLIYKREVIFGQIGFLLQYQSPGLSRWSESLLSTFLYQTHPLIIAFAIISIWFALGRAHTAYLMVIVPALLMTAVAHGRIRYMMPVFPLISIMAAYGLNQTGLKFTKRFLVAASVLSSLALAHQGYLPFLKTNSLANIKQAAEYIDRLDADSVMVYAKPQPGSAVNPAIGAPMLDIYSKKRIVYDYHYVRPINDAELMVSPVRFTWEYKNPLYYGMESKMPSVIVEITPDMDMDDIDGYRLIRKYNVYEGLYKYKTFINIYTAKTIDK